MAIPLIKYFIHDLTFDAKSGQTVAIVGPTGAGKTTIILIC
ncbi:MAG: ATP-binding cassette domain-containing protein [Eubacteriales bacterium]